MFKFMVFLSLAQAQNFSNELSSPILDKDQVKHVQALAARPVAEQVKEISKKFPVEFLKGDAKEKIKDLEGRFGKAECPKSGGIVIYVTNDAPNSMVLHQYIHALQIEKEKRWCELEGRVLELSEKRERALWYHRFEFEALKTLWEAKETPYFGLRDQLIVLEGLYREKETFQGLGIKVFDESTETKFQKEFKEARSQVKAFAWAKRSRVDAGSVLQKMEVIVLKACVEKTVGGDNTVKINSCLKKRCALMGVNCREVSAEELTAFREDLLSQVIHAWVKPFGDVGCPVSKLKDEVLFELANPSPCWKKWYSQRAKSEIDLSLQPAPDETIKRLRVRHYQSPRPEAFINRAYCYFLFERKTDFDSLPIEQFPYARQTVSFSSERFEEYRRWLKRQPQGRSCSELVRTFTGERPSDLEAMERRGHHSLANNLLGVLSGGLTEFKENVQLGLNLEREHLTK